jgi:hypothetical protein
MNSSLGWDLAFLVMAGGGMLGTAALYWSRRSLAHHPGNGDEQHEYRSAALMRKPESHP